MQEGEVIQPDSTGSSAQPPEEPDQSQQPQQPTDSVSWTAQEFIAKTKNAGWFVLFGIVLIAIAVGVYFWVHDVFSAIIILVIGIIFAIVAARQPKSITYQLDNLGIHVGNKVYDYSEFKSFSVEDEGNVSSVVLVPFKRFMPSVTLYYEPKDEDKILDVITAFLPHEESKKDPVDSLMKRMRF